MRVAALRIGFGSGALLLAACSSPGPGGADGETGDGSESGEAGAPVCDEEWSYAERQPYSLLASYGSDELFVGLAWKHVITWDGGTWTTTVLPEAIYPRRAWASAPDSIWFIDAFIEVNRLRYWDGSELTTLATAEAESDLFADVWGSSEHDVWLAGGRNCTNPDKLDCEPILRRFDGATSTEVGGFDLPGLTSIWGRGPDDVFIGTESGMTAHFDGNAWTQHPTSSTPVTHLVGDDAMLYAVAAPNAYRWYGQGWSVLGGGGLPWDFDLATVADGRLWGGLYGYEHLAVWDVSDWKDLDASPYSPRSLASVGGELWVSAADNLAPGSATFVELDVDGSQTVREQLEYVGDAAPIGGGSLDRILALATATNGQAIAEFDGEVWSWRDPQPNTFTVWDAAARADGEEVWKLGFSIDPPATRPELVHELYGTQERWELPAQLGDYFYDVWIESPGVVWVAGTMGVHRFDSESWFSPPLPVNEPPRQVVTAAGHVYVSGSSVIWELVNGYWSAIRSADSIREIAATEPLALWVTESDAMGRHSIARWDGSEWLEFDLGGFSLFQLRARGPDDVWVLGYHTPAQGAVLWRLLHYDGLRWDRTPLPQDSAPIMWVAEDGILLEYDGETYTLHCEGQ